MLVSEDFDGGRGVASLATSASIWFSVFPSPELSPFVIDISVSVKMIVASLAEEDSWVLKIVADCIEGFRLDRVYSNHLI